MQTKGTLICVLAGAAMVAAGASEAVAKKRKPADRAETGGQIACTVTGCQRIPARCHPQTGYNWNGVPTGFDVVVCR